MKIHPDNLFSQLDDLAEIIDTRIALASSSYPYHPTCFWVVVRDNELLCLWSKNVSTTDLKLCRIWNPDRGLTWPQWHLLWLTCHKYL